MKQYTTQIKYIDANVHGIVVMYLYKGNTPEQAEAKSVKALKSSYKKMYGEDDSLEIRGISTEPVFSGMLYQRRWRNPK